MFHNLTTVISHSFLYYIINQINKIEPKKIQTFPAKSNNSQQNIVNNIYLLQIENQELTKIIKDLYQSFNKLLNSMEMLKLENQKLRYQSVLNPHLQQIQGRILQTEQIVQEIQNFGIHKTKQTQMLNDPMIIEQQPPTSENHPYQKILIPIGEQRSVVTPSCQDTKQEIVLIFNKNKRIQQKTNGKIFLGFTEIKKIKYTRKNNLTRQRSSKYLARNK